MNTPQGVVAEDTVFAIDEVITSTQNLISKNINCEVMASGGVGGGKELETRVLTH